MVRGVSFELPVLPVNMNGFYSIFLMKGKRTQFSLGGRVLTFYEVCHGLDTVKEVLSYTFSLLGKVTIIIEFYWCHHH